jgi:hypothetical protein
MNGTRKIEAYIPIAHHEYIKKTSKEHNITQGQVLVILIKFGIQKVAELSTINAEPFDLEAGE